MKFSNIKIKTLLIAGYFVLFFSVIIMGSISYYHASQIHEQLETLYNHPLKVRRALGEIKYDIASIHRSMKDMFLLETEKNIEKNLTQMKLLESDVFEQIQILTIHYLGSKKDVTELKNEFEKWNTIRQETIRLIQEGKVTEAKNRTLADGTGGKQAEVLIKELNDISEFAFNKGEELFKKSEELNKNLNKQLYVIIAFILGISILINYLIIRGINMPLTEIVRAANLFKGGNFSSRSRYQSKNEFGVLSESINQLADTIQFDLELGKKTNSLNTIMVNETTPEPFFKSLLKNLCELTNSQIAAVYIPDAEKNTFHHAFSIGLNENTGKSFSAKQLEGEFGMALSTKSIQHITAIDEQTQFIFKTVGGSFYPKEIITIPMISGDDVIAIVSLASLKTYSEEALRLIRDSWNALSAKIEGVLAYQKNIEFSEKLSQQYSELEEQRIELVKQSSELMEQNTELEFQKKQLDEANRLKTNFLSNMSHELRTPLNSVIALSGVLGRRLSNKIPNEEYGYLEVIERNGKLLLSLINDILDLSRIEAGREDVDIMSFTIQELFEDIVSLLRPQATQKNIIFESQIPSDFPRISSDFGKCRHILQNLVGNAIKFTETGKVMLKAEFDDQRVRFIVTDTGIGIDTENIGHIFDEFRQADGSTARKYGGTGLGLAIAKKYANLIGGHITVKSDVGSGSEFIVHMPLNFSESIQEYDDTYSRFKKPIIGAPKSVTVDKTVLIIDDSEPAIIQLRDILEHKGFKTISARGGNEAFKIIGEQIPDAIILDLMMPETDGFAVLKQIRSDLRTENIPVLVLTAKHITKDDLKVLRKNNISQLIQKGEVNGDDLISAIVGLFEPHETENEEMIAKVNPIQGKPRILVVEDNPDNMITVKAILGESFIVFEAFDGKEGLKMALLHKPDLILMDIALPIMDGIESFKAIRNKPELQHIPVIALTASAMTSDRETILAYGFDAYISKPIEEKIFFKTVKAKLYGE